MKTSNVIWFSLLLLGSAALAFTHYVDINNASPSPPYTSWGTAATNIQDAIDVAVDGEIVLINDGHYLLFQGIVVSNDITVQSVNGPASTVVDGQGNVRIFSLGSQACVLSGLTITNAGDGGVFCSDTTPIVTNCVIIGNSAYSAGGMYMGTANNSIITANSAIYNAGGMAHGIANNCMISGNSAGHYGGGMYGSTANNCIISDNSASVDAGGVYAHSSTLNNCIIAGNSAYHYGGGMRYGTANNCLFIGNSAEYGGAIYGGTAKNCTITGNSAVYSGGGIMGYVDIGSANNCIAWHNNAPDSKDLGAVVAYYCCAPDVVHGVDGNITNAPLFIGSGNYRLGPNSPCINAGSNGYVSGATDLDGNPRIVDGTVDMGAFECFYVTNSYTSASGCTLEWMLAPIGWNSVVQYSTNLVTMPFTDLSAPMPYPMNSYTDLSHSTESECFYKVEISP